MNFNRPVYLILKPLNILFLVFWISNTYSQNLGVQEVNEIISLSSSGKHDEAIARFKNLGLDPNRLNSDEINVQKLFFWMGSSFMRKDEYKDDACNLLKKLVDQILKDNSKLNEKEYILTLLTFNNGCQAILDEETITRLKTRFREITN